jgi:hypothetical protein
LGWWFSCPDSSQIETLKQAAIPTTKYSKSPLERSATHVARFFINETWEIPMKNGAKCWGYLHPPGDLPTPD